VLLEQAPRQRGDRQVELAEAAGDGEHLGCRALVGEAAGVAHDPGVQARGHVTGQRQVEALDQPVHEDGRRCRAGVDDVDGPVAVVGDVVVDDDELAGRLGRAGQLAEPVDRAAVEGHHDVGLGWELVGPHQEVEARQQAVVGRDDERLGERGQRRASSGPQRVVQAERRPEGIAVGVHVAGQRHRSGSLEGGDRPLEGSLRITVQHRLPLRRSPASPG
jgi:hypothetical protein